MTQDMFKNRVGNYVRRLVSKTKPKKVVICMIYYLDEQSGGSWADGALAVMCYNWNPGKLQCAIRKVFELATSQIRIEGTEVVGFPLFEVLDGKNTHDYHQRVEPSPSGGEKMAAALMDVVLRSEVVDDALGQAASTADNTNEGLAISLEQPRAQEDTERSPLAASITRHHLE